MGISFGKTWWGKKWLQSLNNIDYQNRLGRGASYANKGAVLQIQINKNKINAKVQGSQPKPYTIGIVLPPFFDPQVGEFIKALAQKPVIISKLLNRDLDPSVLDIAEKIGLKVFPTQWTDFKMQCSCPDWAVPCKHIASVIYKMSSEIDNDPFLVFHLHEVDITAELNKRGIVVNTQHFEIPELTHVYVDLKKKPKKESNEIIYKKIVFSKLSPLYESLVALLTDSPAFYTARENFKEKYLSRIEKMAKNTQKVLYGKRVMDTLFEMAPTQSLKNISHKDHYKIVVDEKNYIQIVNQDEEVSLVDFMQQLSKIDTSKIVDYHDTTIALHTIFFFSLHLIGNGAIVPQIVQLSNSGKSFFIRWLPARISKVVRELMDELELMLPSDMFFLKEKHKLKEINKHVCLNLVSLFLTEIVALFDNKQQSDKFFNLFFNKLVDPFKNPGEEALPGGVMAWTQKYFITQGRFKPQLMVEEVTEEEFKILINIEDTTQSYAVPIPLKKILNEKTYNKIRYEVLSTLTQLSSFIYGLDVYINSLGVDDIVMDNKIFTTFLIEMIPVIQLLDISILLPKSLQEILRPKPSMRIKRKNSKEKSFLRLDALLEFDWQVALGDTIIDANEFNKLLKKSDGLIKYKTNYVYVNDKDMEKLYKHFLAVKEFSPFEILRTALSGQYEGSPIYLTEEVQKMIDELTKVEVVPLPEELKATMRPYQERGFSWMYRNAQVGFGSVIADDMGLGKTLQVIATLLKFKEKGFLKKEKILVIAPTGLLINWQKELEKFAPSLISKIYHGASRKVESDDTFDILISSYGIIRSDVKNIKKMKWHSVVIDEAQNIKNIHTEQTKAVKSIPAKNFIAMSGTPVENRLSELWSIMDYANRGLLGHLKEFNDDYGTPIQQFNDIQLANRLKKITAPFMIRRLKSDKSIISDLPDKIEMDCFSALTKEQVSLYEKTLEEAMVTIDMIDTANSKELFIRQGLVLQMILALKQICNHPTQFLKNKILDWSLSGKMELLFDKLDSMVESRDKVLLFTQFTEMGHLLKHFITERYHDQPLFYHGGCTLKDRESMVNKFQVEKTEKIFILSLRAAGTGLNLTRANHVIHYDLWWNPAVEAQATDRAYRIGQKNNVMVHRFITKNTFEERINEMIQSKKNLANMTISTGENWIGNLSNKELREVFQITETKN